ncbi:MAG: 8-oxo-dGTP diphosphatase MutT [candidate division KSB1 bacterium]|nr:8-oxo-dGTP diphosphatase MutT [candidate division KSB1 bacterium]MDZ7319987.1 8-oxo-dGTP diphosphatase MutT [candidate division KSB1 bacterium]MDZ7340990.1 8-oxo-dGTP diphosphatase MutT [candidate division KSB1 bacterium]
MQNNQSSGIAPSHAEVTAALIIHEGKILITQRPINKIFGGLWEFPGGKQQPGESLADCLRRELLEELNIIIEEGPLLFSVEHSYEHLGITLHVFLCTRWQGELQPREVQDWRWLAPADLNSYPLTPADQKVVQKIMSSEVSPALLKLLSRRHSYIS